MGTADKKFWLGGGLVNGRWFWLTGAPIHFTPTVYLRGTRFTQGVVDKVKQVLPQSDLKLAG